MKAAFRRTKTGPAQKQAQQQDVSVYGITTADEPLSADIARRQKQYLISMAFRLVAIAVVVWVPGVSLPIKAVLGVVATVIPFFAVISANGAPTPDHQSTNLLLAPPGPPALEGRGSVLGPGEEFVTGDFVAGAGAGRDWDWGGQGDGPDQGASAGEDART